MTTNQTIGGVPRALLGNISVYLADSPNAIMRARAKELRALLDAPAVQWLAMEVNGKSWVIKEGPNAEKWRAMGYELFPVQPAAQPQGEPVAWMDPRSPEMHATISNEVKQHNLKFGGAPSAAVNGYSIPLYAEQPAPVAVVMPERKEIIDHSSHDGGKRKGWNACLEEVKRLNK